MRIKTADEHAAEEAPRVSIVVPCYNQARFLPDAVASLKAQTMTDWQAVIVNDGSTDDSAHVALGLIAGDPRLSVLGQSNRGLSMARNAGLWACNPFAQSVLFLDGDDALLPNALETLEALLDASPDAVGAVGRAVPADALLRPDASLWKFPPAPDTDRLTFPDVVGYGGLYPPSVALIRRWAVDAAGPFDPMMPSVEDWDWFLRVALVGPLAFQDVAVTLYRRHQANATSDGALMAQGQEAAWRRVPSYRTAWAAH